MKNQNHSIRTETNALAKASWAVYGQPKFIFNDLLVNPGYLMKHITLILVFMTVIALPGIAQTSVARMIDVDDQTFRFLTAGLEHMQIRRPLVVLEGSGGERIETWMSVFDAISGYAPVIAYDRAGLGQSSWDGKRPTVKRRNRQLHALLSRLELLPPYMLAGHSWGGALIHGFAGEFPHKVDGLIYINPTPLLHSPEDEINLYREMGTVNPKAAADAR